MRLDNRNYDRKVYLVKFKIAGYLFNTDRYVLIYVGYIYIYTHIYSKNNI